MSSVNKVILLGNCGRDPEVRYLPSGQAVANVSVATTSKRKNKDTGETVEDTQWHRVTFYDRLAEIAGEYVTKGKQIYVEGRLKYGKYTDKDGVEKNTCDVVGTELQLLGGGRDDRQGGDDQGGYAPQPQQRQQQPQRPAQQQPRQGGYQQRPPQQPQRPAQPVRQAPPRQPDPFEDDDIPF